MRNAAYWLIHYDLPSLVSYTTQDCLPRDGTAHSELGHTSIINKTIPPGPICWRHVLSWGSLFTDDPQLCQVHIKPSYHGYPFLDGTITWLLGGGREPSVSSNTCVTSNLGDWLLLKWVSKIARSYGLLSEVRLSHFCSPWLRPTHCGTWLLWPLSSWSL